MICFICNDEFFDIKLYICHLKIIHKLEDGSEFKCSFCGRWFDVLSSFKRHIEKEVKNVNYNPIDDFSVNVHAENSNEFIQGDQVCEDSNIFTEDSQNSEPQSNLQQTSERMTIALADESEKTSEDDIDIRRNFLSFVLNLYGDMSLNRKHANAIINDMNSLIFEPLVHKIEKLNNETQSILQLKAEIMELKIFFEKFSSEYKVKQYLGSLNLYNEPEEFVIQKINNVDNLNDCKSTGILFPLKKNLEAYFSVPGVMDAMVENLKKYETDKDLISNICQGSVWKSKIESFDKQKVIIPYILYQDDHDITCTSSSKSGKNKTSAFYITFPLQTDNEKSKLENIFVSCLTKSSDLVHGMSANYNNFVQQLKELEDNGVDITYNRERTTIFFVMGVMVGDNLSLNTILGM